MQNAVVDRKAQLLFDKYWDSEYVATSQRDIEQMRNRASTMGLATSIAAFGLNEVARLTMRSRKFFISHILIRTDYSNVQVEGSEFGFLGSRTDIILAV